ncbi:MAG TPA: cytochrome b [Paracoccus sp. (in: a-proteobacteria)]|uniref:cytochrome b n=1 Tax=Paracoccus sp. TaxID=267 RepID=UPI002BFB5A85|nr:cytochrome b [Paracoccus sp. (in: a-proteobacteria)]HWL57739.1 cytochrome b [Paracoccus sp. (in: a-proteobacteria)]
MSLHPEGYRKGARLLHWGMAVLVLLMIVAGLLMVQKGLPRPLQDALFLMHKHVGLLILFLVALRILFRWMNPPPPLPTTMPDWQRRIARASHVLLYVLLVAMPVLGFIRVRAGGFPIELLDALGLGGPVPRSESLAQTAMALHRAGAFLLIGLICLHVGAATHHALIRRDGVWQRMWPPFGGN